MARRLGTVLLILGVVLSALMIGGYLLGASDADRTRMPGWFIWGFGSIPFWIGLAAKYILTPPE